MKIKLPTLNSWLYFPAYHTPPNSRQTVNSFSRQTTHVHLPYEPPSNEFTSRLFSSEQYISHHNDLPELEAVDRAAKQTTSLAKFTDNSHLATDHYKNQYRSSILQSWNNFWENQPSNKFLHIKKNSCTLVNLKYKFQTRGNNRH